MKKFLILAGVVAGGMLAVGAPAQAAAKAEGCAAYTYIGTSTTICDRFPGNADRDCPQLDGTVKVKSRGTDPWRLDRDKDGTGCEGDALKPIPSSIPEDPANPGDDNDDDKAAPVLPKTGPDGPAVPLIIGGSVFTAGVGVMMVMARRRVKFTA